ncbi:NAD(P)/FAD-dependent oxidoreductase [Mesorhizobium australicum]|uniref:NAD(P)/FAD-dependent oxidoreductase n=1 Tax=Mesorhizobium australicum TaxID=536018 RepID=UPI00333A1B96
MKRSLGLQRHATIAACHLLNLKSSSVRLADPGQRYLEVGILSRQLAETITFGGDHIRSGVGNDAPARSVLLLEAGRHDRPKPGEVLPAVANGLLRQLGVWTPFAEAGFVENRALVSVGANEVPSERHGMFSAQGAGWQLDRTRFDRLMVQAAKAAGVDTRFGSAVGSAVRDDQGWLLKLADEAIVARAVVWATGRSWRLARCFGAKLTMHGHLAAYTRFFDTHRAIAAWSSRRVPKAGGTAPTCACLTDPDLGSELRKAGHWYQALAATQSIAPLVPPNAIETASMIKAAGTAIDPAAGNRWVAAGDCLFCADPLSSRGIVHALRSGILAAYAASDMLDGRGDSPAPAMQNRHTRLCRLAPSTGCPLCSRRAMGHAFLAAAAQPCLPRV